MCNDNQRVSARYWVFVVEREYTRKADEMAGNFSAFSSDSSRMRSTKSSNHPEADRIGALGQVVRTVKNACSNADVFFG